MKSPKKPLAVLASPSAAYRADLGEGRSAFGPNDDQWLAAASSLHLAGRRQDDERKEHLYTALGIAIDALGDDRIDAFVRREWRGEHCYAEALAILADNIHWAGGLHLAAVMLDDVLQAASDLSVLQRGRILALRARVEWKLGHLDQAADRYAYIASLGAHDDTKELVTRAEIGFLTLAQLRGNIPEVRERAPRAVELAERHGHAQLARLAYQGAMIGEAKAGNFEKAVTAGWVSLQLSREDPIYQAEALQNLGQLLLESGHASLSRACFAAVMELTLPARVLLPSLGGLALASAHSAQEPTVEWATREVWNAQHRAVPAYELADALVECAEAHARLGRSDSEPYRSAALAIATANGFNEIVFRAEAMETQQRRDAEPQSAAAKLPAKMAYEISELEPERLPEHARFEAAPA